MASELSIRRLRKSDEVAIEDLLVNDVYRWRPWIVISLQHGLFTIFPYQIFAFFLSLLVAGWTLGRLDVAIWAVITITVLICVVSLLMMEFIIRYVRSYPEFAARNLTETYSEEGCAFFVAELAGKIVGCVGVKKRNDEVRERRAQR